MGKLSDLPNVGKTLEKDLIEVGISTPEELCKVGAREAFLRIKALKPKACVCMLYRIQGAIEGVKDTYLSEEKKRELKNFYRSL
ncbi:MAG: TfoX/Sxy family protein [Acetivibrionales bacterium]|jgi:DNA transformation protein